MGVTCGFSFKTFHFFTWNFMNNFNPLSYWCELIKFYFGKHKHKRSVEHLNIAIRMLSSMTLANRRYIPIMVKPTSLRCLTAHLGNVPASYTAGSKEQAGSSAVMTIREVVQPFTRKRKATNQISLALLLWT